MWGWYHWWCWLLFRYTCLFWGARNCAKIFTDIRSNRWLMLQILQQQNKGVWPWHCHCHPVAMMQRCRNKEKFSDASSWDNSPSVCTGNNAGFGGLYGAPHICDCLIHFSAPELCLKYCIFSIFFRFLFSKFPFSEKLFKVILVT